MPDPTNEPAKEPAKTSPDSPTTTQPATGLPPTQGEGQQVKETQEKLSQTLPGQEAVQKPPQDK